MSLEGKQYYVVAYNYDNNYIDAVPRADLKDKTIVNTVKTVFRTMEEKGHCPCFNVIDNQVAKPLKAYLKIKDCKWQFVEPHNYCVTAAERAIQTLKNRMISRLCCTDSKWPLQLWDQLTEQGQITLNICRTSRKHPDKSAYHLYNGHHYDWNKHPMAPLGTRAVIYQPPDSRTSWGPRGMDVWYCGPVFDHYHNLILLFPRPKLTKHQRLMICSRSAAFYLHCQTKNTPRRSPRNE